MASATTLWPQEHSDFLTKLISTPQSFTEITAAMNAEFRTSYSRNAILGRAYRMNQSVKRPPIAPEIRAERRRQTEINKAAKKKAARHAAKPWLAIPKINRADEQRRVRAMFEATGTSRTSAGYRKHFPRLPDMSKDELRGMLADAMRNTAAMS